MVWVKAFHVVFMVTWFSGLFYLPRLFVYHAMATDTISIERFKLMERKLYYGIMAPGGLLTIVTGLWLLSLNPSFYLTAGWFHAKLSLVLLTIIYHCYLGQLRKAFKLDQNKHGHVFYRILNEVPLLFLLGIVIMVIVRPF